PLVTGLFVPETGRAALAVRDDAPDRHPVRRVQTLEVLLVGRRRQVGEELPHEKLFGHRGLLSLHNGFIRPFPFTEERNPPMMDQAHPDPEAAELAPDDLRALAEARELLERSGLAIRLSNFVGSPIEKGIARLPAMLRDKLGILARVALERAMETAAKTLDD